MYNLTISNLLKSGVHLGHSISKFNPKIKPYLLRPNKGLHLIDLYKTNKQISSSCLFLNKLSASGKIVLFVGTKKQAKKIIAYYAKHLHMPYINERWIGGLLTNWATIRQSIDKMNLIQTNQSSGLYNLRYKKERLLLARMYTKLKKNLGSVSHLNVRPDCIVIIDINKEQAAVQEALTLGIPIVGIVDTNSDPENIHFPIPANDDNSKSINMILYYIANAIESGVHLYFMNNQLKHVLCKQPS
ncbi:30S ribosomal protein S2 [Candidatus Karelsulcia muelleri]